MKKRIALFAVLAGLLVAASFVPLRGQSFSQTLMNWVSLGPRTSGTGVLQVNIVNKATDINAASLTKLITAPSTGQIYVDGIFLQKATATTGTVTLRYGTGTNCGTGTTTLAFIGAATSTSAMPLGYYPLKIQVPAGKDLCAIVDATSTDALVLAQ